MPAIAYSVPRRAVAGRGIPLDKARLCTVCWTVHKSDDCPECGARQWMPLAPMLRGSLCPDETRPLRGIRP